MSAPPLRTPPEATAPSASTTATRTRAAQDRPATVRGCAPDAAFGAGSGEPYVRLLTGQDLMPGLWLRGADGTSHRLDAGSWIGPAGEADLAVLDRASGPVLDVGCGPGRMLHAAALRSLPALGIDIALGAVARARVLGGLALHRSVFDRLPLEGRWRCVLLLDGNIGIGGDPTALLRRCAELLAADGAILVEVDAEPDLVVLGECTVHDDDGRESAPFPWARVGWSAIHGLAAAAGLAVAEHWDAAGRHFVCVVPSARRTAVRETRNAIAATAASTSQMTPSARP
ncbi:class I SAM-dependent methyltransferase [Agromyces sp. SYSU T0242]|uniref:class I SAM-dependent methyltransferase n=1 Tax=Agromyces litoreus TaxID=3158561 RepID=UPI0033947944